MNGRGFACGATASLTTKPSARARRSAEYGRRSVVGPEACGFVRRRHAVRDSSSRAAPTGTNAARRADTKACRALRRDTKRLRVSSRTASLRKMSVRPEAENLTRSHGGTEFLLKRRGGGESLFVFRRTSKPFSCRTVGARSWRFVVARSAETLWENNAVSSCETLPHAETQRPQGGARISAVSAALRENKKRETMRSRRFLTQRTQRGKTQRTRRPLRTLRHKSLWTLRFLKIHF